MVAHWQAEINTAQGDASAILARSTNTVILPANVADVAGLIATAMSVVKTPLPAGQRAEVRAP